MNKGLFLLIFFSLPYFNIAQSIKKTLVYAVVLDSVQKKLLSYTTVILLNSKINLPVKSTLTINTGIFDFLIGNNLSLNIEINSFGFKTKIIRVKNTFSLGTILVSPTSKLLVEVVVMRLNQVYQKKLTV